MEKAIVVGASGGTGASITEEHVKRGIRARKTIKWFFNINK